MVPLLCITSMFELLDPLYINCSAPVPVNLISSLEKLPYVPVDTIQSNTDIVVGFNQNDMVCVDPVPGESESGGSVYLNTLLAYCISAFVPLKNAFLKLTTLIIIEINQNFLKNHLNIFYRLT